MKLTSMEGVLSALQQMKHHIEVAGGIRDAAYRSVARMLTVTGQRADAAGRAS
jgi:quinolinate synthase